MLVKGVPCSSMGCQGHVSHPCEKCGRLAAGAISLSATSPALRERSNSYPERWEGRVPKQVRMLKTVRPDLPFLVVGQALVARKGEVYDVWVNRNGAVSVILDEGTEKADQLGVKPDEFEVVDWHDRRPLGLHLLQNISEEEFKEAFDKLDRTSIWFENPVFVFGQDEEE